MTVYTVIRPHTRPASLRVLETRSRWAKIGRPGSNTDEQYGEAKMLVEGSTTPNDTIHHASQVILLQSPDPAALDRAIREMMRISAQFGVTLVREGKVDGDNFTITFPNGNTGSCKRDTPDHATCAMQPKKGVAWSLSMTKKSADSKAKGYGNGCDYSSMNEYGQSVGTKHLGEGDHTYVVGSYKVIVCHGGSLVPELN
jgi:hypothetical protein